MTRQPPPSRAFTLALCAVAALSTLLFCVVLVPAPALALPEGRVYEMVSPPYKGGYDAAGIGSPDGVAGVGINGVASNGESVMFESLGAFAGEPTSQVVAGNANRYLARRGPEGWSTVPLTPPASFAPRARLVAISPSLQTSLFFAEPGTNYTQQRRHPRVSESRHETPDEAGGWEVAGMGLQGLHKEPLGNPPTKARASISRTSSSAVNSPNRCSRAPKTRR